jgi:NADPH2:quinone reductase
VTHAISMQQVGGPEVLQWTAIDVPRPGALEARIRQEAVGVNFADVYMRTGNHPAKLKFPAILGVEAAGTIEEVGSEVRGFAAGDRVAYFGVLGAYTEARLVPVEKLVKLPATIPGAVAAAILVKGITARYLCRQAFAVASGDVVLIHAAAGGIGALLTQWTAALGATVIGTVGSEQKVDFARANGCHHVIVSAHEQLAERVSAITKGEKASVVFDGLGGDATLLSLDCLRPRGTLVIFGRTAGFPHAIIPFEHLMQKGSLKVTMTQLLDFAGTRTDIDTAVSDLFSAVEAGRLRAAIGQTYALRDVQQAHRDLEGRKTVGSIVLTV